MNFLHRYMDSAKALEKDSSFGLCHFDVCDNVDLDTVLMEYESYYFIKFQKYPKLTKKLPEQGESLFFVVILLLIIHQYVLKCSMVLYQ